MACGREGPTSPVNVAPALAIVAGGATTDTVQARPVQALVIEVRDTTGGGARGKTVRFEALPPDDPKRKTETAIAVSSLTSNAYSAFASDLTDSVGRAKTLVGFGTVAGPARVRVTVPEFGMTDTIVFTVKPGLPAKFIIGTRDTVVQPGATYSLNASVVDRFSNLVPTETPTFSPGSGIVSVSPGGQVVVGSAIARGQIVVSWKTVTDTARVTVMPRLPLVASRSQVIRTVVLVNTDGTGYTELASSSDFSLSPHAVTGSPVVFYQGNPDFGASVWIVTPGSPPRVLASTTNGFQSAAWPRWSPDGTWIYFTGFRSGSTRALFRIRPDGSQIDSLGTVTTGAIYMAPSISPDGSTAAVPDATGIKLITIATKASTVIPANCGGPRYSPDGKRFACVSGGSLSVMNADGTGTHVLSPGAFVLSDLANTDWSPDGAWLMVVGTGPQLVNANDGTVIPLALGSSYQQIGFVR